jgi:hypothetical protein
MKTKIIILSTLIIAVIALFACVKTIDNPTPQEKVLDVTSEQSLNSFIQNHYDKKYKLLVETVETKSEDVVAEIRSDYLVRVKADTLVNEINDIKQIRAQSDVQYVGYEVRTKIKNGTIKDDGSHISFLVYVYYNLTLNDIDTETGNQLISSGIDLYEIIAQKQDDTYKIIKETHHSFIGGSEAESLNDVNLYNYSEPISKSSISYTYSSKSAVRFACLHWNNVSKIKNYCDYKDMGGDCTNFLSYCLYKGNWIQNNSWFFITDGSSGNDMKKYKRSPSWTKAKDFYNYITATGSMYKNSKGNNRVIEVFSNLKVPNLSSRLTSKVKMKDFYNNIKLLNVGDIVEIGNGHSPATITHNMIVTEKTSKEPYIYLTYRNDSADGHDPHLNKSIDELKGYRLYGFNVRSKVR